MRKSSRLSRKQAARGGRPSSLHGVGAPDEDDSFGDASTWLLDGGELLRLGDWIAREWTAEEKERMIYALFCHGPGRWSLLCTEARLEQRGKSSVDSYNFFRYVYTECVQRLKGNDSSSTGPSVAADAVVSRQDDCRVRKSDEHDDDDDDDDDDDEEHVSSSSSRLAEHPPNIALGMSVTDAHRMFARVQFWMLLRQTILRMPSELLVRRIACARRDPTMPDWWAAGSHDVALLHTVDTYGMGGYGRKWRSALDDSDCPFYVDGDDGRVASHRGDGSGAPSSMHRVARSAMDQREKYLQKLSAEPCKDLIYHLRYLFRVILAPMHAQVSHAEDMKKRRWHANYPPPLPTQLAPHHVDMASSGAPPNGPGASAAAGGGGGGGGKKRTSRRPGGGKGKASASSSKRRGGDAPRRLPSVRGEAVQVDSDGMVVCPFLAKGASVECLGRVVYDRAGFHSKSYILPAGFRSTRRMRSYITPDEYTMYTSEIIDTGLEGPVFRVTAHDDPKVVHEAETSSGAWVLVLRKIRRKSSVAVSGPETFGYSDATVRYHIQRLENATRCGKYRFIDFVVDAANGRAAKPDKQMIHDAVSGSVWSRRNVAVSSGGTPSKDGGGGAPPASPSHDASTQRAPRGHPPQFKGYKRKRAPIEPSSKAARSTMKKKNGKHASYAHFSSDGSETSRPSASQSAHGSAIMRGHRTEFDASALEGASKRTLLNVCRELTRARSASFFREPVPLEVPGYHEIILHPLDLSGILKDIQSDKITSGLELLRSVYHMCENAFIFNPVGSVYHEDAHALKQRACRDICKAIADQKLKDTTRRKKSRSRNAS